MKKRISTILAISTAFILFYSSISHAQEIDLKKIRELESVTQDLLNNKYNPTSESNMGCFAHDSSSTGQFSLNPKKNDGKLYFFIREFYGVGSGSENANDYIEFNIDNINKNVLTGKMDITSNSDEMSYPKTESNIIFELKIENNGKDVSINYKEYGSLKKCTLKRKSS